MSRVLLQVSAVQSPKTQEMAGQHEVEGLDPVSLLSAVHQSF